MKKYFMLLLLSTLTAGVLFSGCSTTQTAAEKAQTVIRTREKVESRHFTFHARSANPMRYKTIHLTSSYELKVRKDTVTAYLPYFGRTYYAPSDPTEGGFKFTSTNFRYDMVSGKRPGNWKITIKTLDTHHILTLFLDVWENGSTQLTVTDPDREAITFDGDIND